METGVFADRDGTVTEVLVTAGTQVETKQLMMVIGDPGESADDAGEEPAEDAGEQPAEKEG